MVVRGAALMPDFSMCGSDTCPVRFLCRRHPDSGTEPAGRFQTWSAFEPSSQQGCSFRMDLLGHTAPMNGHYAMERDGDAPN